MLASRSAGSEGHDADALVAGSQSRTEIRKEHVVALGEAEEEAADVVTGLDAQPRQTEFERFAHQVPSSPREAS